MGCTHNKVAPASEHDSEFTNIPQMNPSNQRIRKSKSSKSLPNVRPGNDKKLFQLRDRMRGNFNKKELKLPLENIDLNQIDLEMNLYTHRNPPSSKLEGINVPLVEFETASSVPVKQASDLQIEQISLGEFQMINNNQQKVNIRYTEEYMENLIKFSDS